MPDTPIPPEAAWVEYRDAETRRRDRRALRKRDFLAGFAAALPHLAHVSPSVEDAREEAAQRYLSYGVSPEGEAFVAGAQWASSSQPTVEQVRRETLLSAADDLEATALSPRYSREEFAAWLRARAAEAVDR